MPVFCWYTMARCCTSNATRSNRLPLSDPSKSHEANTSATHRSRIACEPNHLEQFAHPFSATLGYFPTACRNVFLNARAIGCKRYTRVYSHKLIHNATVATRNSHKCPRKTVQIGRAAELTSAQNIPTNSIYLLLNYFTDDLHVSFCCIFVWHMAPFWQMYTNQNNWLQPITCSCLARANERLSCYGWNTTWITGHYHQCNTCVYAG